MSLLPSANALADAGTGDWTGTANLQIQRTHHTATLLDNGKVLVVGGFNSSYATAVELYDPATGNWTYGGALQTPRMDHTVVRLNDGSVLVTAGSGINSYFASAERYNPTTNS
jgi:hypothetical protein